MFDMVLSEKSTGLRLAPSQHNDSCRTVKEKSNPISNKSTSYSRQRQLRGTGENAPVVSNSKEVQPEKSREGSRNSTEAAAPSSQLSGMKWHDFQNAEKTAWNYDKKNIFLFIYSFNMVAIGMAIMSPNVVFDVALFLIALNAVCAYIQLNLMRSL